MNSHVTCMHSRFPNIRGSHMSGGPDGAHNSSEQDALNSADTGNIIGATLRRVLKDAGVKAHANNDLCSHELSDFSI